MSENFISHGISGIWGKTSISKIFGEFEIFRNLGNAPENSDSPLTNSGKKNMFLEAIHNKKWYVHTPGTRARPCET